MTRSLPVMSILAETRRRRSPTLVRILRSSKHTVILPSPGVYYYYSFSCLLKSKMSASKIVLLASAVGVAMAFHPSASVSRPGSALKVAVDANTVTKKEYEDICGVSFDEKLLEQRLERTSYLYPKHVEVVDDIAPIAGAMVDEIVSSQARKALCCLDRKPLFWIVH